MPTIKTATLADREAIRTAIDHLRSARNLLARAGAPRAAKAASRALASAEGAGRHVEHRLRRSPA